MSTIPSKSSYDVAVVGGGAVGLACAWRIALRGRSVLLAERDRPGAGASGVAAGMLAPVTEAEFGEQDLLRANLASGELWPGFAAELAERSGLSPGFRESGALVVAADRDDAEELRRLHDFQRRLGLDAEWLTPSAARRAEPGLSPRIAGAIHAPQDHQVDPGALVSALTAAVEGAGGELATGVEVAAVDAHGVTLADGRRVDAGHVVLAAGCWSASLAGIPVRPVKGQVLHCRARGPERLCVALVRSPRCYVVDRGDGRVLVGATVEERGFDTRVTAEGVFRLLEAAIELLPDVEELEFEGAAAGLRPATPDNMPLVGPAEDGVLLATGHYRNGILLAPLTAQVVAAVVCGEPVPEAAVPLSPARRAGSPA
ncbi:MAG: glycine oxidase ThiO [Thermoleophilaceae bacterium]